jgi:hypothetical protein
MARLALVVAVGIPLRFTKRGMRGTVENHKARVPMHTDSIEGGMQGAGEGACGPRF